MDYIVDFNKFFELTQKELSKISGYNRYRSNKLFALIQRLGNYERTNFTANYENAIFNLMEAIRSKKSSDELISLYKDYAEYCAFLLNQHLSAQVI